ncbi:LOW QUALITY PROTEIN: uncharacterized protein Atac2 [Panulirus ornatus]|uniref:LOW QUALITY PROTEIN: uncharacterized protein Atac2 n=1 Tax=Panulirus ornatus TaxID=150431 RepID=UPI003A89B0D0
MLKMATFVPNTSCGPCLYCNGTSQDAPEDLLRCDLCRRSAHILCLKSGVPEGCLLGDNFFNFTCSVCHVSGQDITVRARLNMPHILLLVLYNLHKTEVHTSRCGFFHWKIHIYNFINHHWKEIFGPESRKRKKKVVQSSLSGQLSCYGQYFVSGYETLRDGGWYKLVVPLSPARLIQKQLGEKGRGTAVGSGDLTRSGRRKILKDEPSKASGLAMQDMHQVKEELVEESVSSGDVSFDSHDDSSRGSWFTERELLKPHACPPQALFDSEEEEEQGNDSNLYPQQVKIESGVIVKEEIDIDLMYRKEENQDDTEREEEDGDFIDVDGNEGEIPMDVQTETQPQEDPLSFKPSLFTKSIAPSFIVKDQPNESKEVIQENLRPLSGYEERQLLRKLEYLQESGPLPPHLHRLRRKLVVRCGKSSQTSLPLSQNQYKHGMCAITSPVTKNEKECLIKIVKEFQGLIDDYSTVAVFRKAAVWQVIAARFNTATGNRKSSQQVRKIWERIRSRARKDYIRMKLQKRRTGEGPPPTLLDPLSSQVLPLIRKELEPIDKAWDRDAGLRVEALLQESVYVSDAIDNSLPFTSISSEPLSCLDGMSAEPEKTQQGSSTKIHESVLCNTSSLRVFGSGASGLLHIPSVGNTPHQPKTAAFPKRVFGKANPVARSFQPSWFHRWPWIHYDEANDRAFCHVCVKAYTQNLISSAVIEPLFISRGFTNWKDVTTKRGFPAHERSDCHREAVEHLLNSPAKKQDTREHLPAEHEEEKAVNRRNLLKILSNIQFLARQGLAIQGDCDDSNSNFFQLCRLRGEDDPQLMAWIMKKGGVYTSAEFLDEMLEVMGYRVLREVATCLHNTDFFSIVVDETDDLSSKLQLIVCIRWVDDDLNAHEEFIGLNKLEMIDAPSVTSMIKDVLLQMNLSMQNARGQCYDGCSSLGEKKNVATQIKQCEPRCLYCDCCGHSLSLTCVDLIKNIRLINEALETTHEITRLIKEFPKCDAEVENMKKTMNEERQDLLGICALCPTRWSVGAKAVNSIIENYAFLKELWTWALSHCSDSELKAKVRGIRVHMMTFDFFFGLVLVECLLQHVNSLCATLKNKNLSAAEGQSVAAVTVTTLSSLQTAQAFEHFWATVIKKAEENEIDSLKILSLRRATSQFEDGQGTSKYQEMTKDMYKNIYHETLNLIISCIKDQFDQQDYKMYVNCEQLLLKAACGRDFTDEFHSVTNFFGSDFIPQELQTHLNTLTQTMSCEGSVLVSDVLMYLQSLSLSQQKQVSQVVKLAKLILVMPITNAANENLCSALRHIRMNLQATVTQNHMKHLMILHVHKERTTSLSLVDVANEFVSRAEHRLGVFGKFTTSDLAKNKVLAKEKSIQYSFSEMQ